MRRYLRSFANGESLLQVVKVGLIGVVNTVVSIGLFRILLIVMGGEAARTDGFDLRLFLATAISFGLTTLLSYVLNRRWTFALEDPTGTRRETVRFFAINGVAWAITQAIVSGANIFWGPLTDNQATIAYIAAAGVIILPKFAGYRDLVFRKALDEQPDAQGSRATHR